MRTFLMVVGAALLLVLLPAHGEAQNVPSEINRYRAVSVTFSENAGKCNLADDSMLRAKLTSELANAGVQQSDASRLVVNYAVSANAFGPLNINCVFSTTLNFLVRLGADNINTDDPAARAAIDRLGSVDVILYSNGFFGTENQKQPPAGGKSTSVRDRVLDNIKLSVDKFVADRAG
jgi:hypothetical protein